MSGFGRPARLLRRTEFEAVLKAAEVRASNSYFRISGRDTGRAQARLGIAVPKKAARRAVARSRIKRVIRESFRHRRSRLEARDYVVGAKPGAAQADNETLFRALAELWERVGSDACAQRSSG